MAYASYSDVQAHLSFVATFTASSRPNASQVHQHLVDASDELDSALRLADYTTPITAAGARETVRAWTAIGAAAHTAYAMPQGTDSKHAQALEKRWQALLTDIRQGNRQLDSDGGRDSRRSRPRYGGSSEPTFSIDESR